LIDGPLSEKKYPEPALMERKSISCLASDLISDDNANNYGR
jgi:hypothetical protein